MNPKRAAEKGKTPEELKIACEETLSWLKLNRKKDLISYPQGLKIRNYKRQELRRILKTLGVNFPYLQDYIKEKITLDSAIEHSRNLQVDSQVSEVTKAVTVKKARHLTNEEKQAECKKVRDWLKSNSKRQISYQPGGEQLWNNQKKYLKSLLSSLHVIKPFLARYMEGNLPIDKAVKLSRDQSFHGGGPRLAKVDTPAFTLTKRLPGSFGG